MRPDPQETANLVTFTEEIVNGKLHFLCSNIIPSHTCTKQFTEFVVYWCLRLLTSITDRTLNEC